MTYTMTAEQLNFENLKATASREADALRGLFTKLYRFVYFLKQSGITFDLFGGSVRDALLGLPCHDVDLHVPYEHIETLRGYLRHAGWDVAEESDGRIVFSQLNNLIDVVKTESKLWYSITQADVTASACGLTSDFVLVCHPLFFRDLRSKTLRLVGNGAWGQASTLIRAGRMIERGYTPEALLFEALYGKAANGKVGPECENHVDARDLWEIPILPLLSVDKVDEIHAWPGVTPPWITLEATAGAAKRIVVRWQHLQSQSAPLTAEWAEVELQPKDWATDGFMDVWHNTLDPKAGEPGVLAVVVLTTDWAGREKTFYEGSPKLLEIIGATAPSSQPSTPQSPRA